MTRETPARAVIYSRFSTDLQNERSIEDQRAICEAFAAREGLTIVASYEDAARSGGSLFGRDGLMRLMEAAQAGAFEVVIVEALDRLSRDMEDLAGLHKRLTFLGIEIRAINEGVVNTVLVGLRGLVGQLYREDNAQKVRRGMAGVVRAGKAGGGLSYGYATVAGDPGRRVIDEAEAAIVRRIFREFIEGKSPRQIAFGLNAEGVPPPRGGKWNASTINGSGSRANGILRNEIYAGRLVWNRLRMLKDPDTGKRVSRRNPPSEWHIVDVPELAIVPREDFDAVQEMKKSLAGERPEKQKRAKHLLSGLLKCAACGSGMSATGKDKTGRTRIRCSRWIESRSCPDPHSFYLPEVEAAVIEALRAEMMSPRATAEYVRTYHEERQRLAARDNAERDALTRRLDRAAAELTRVVDAIAKGIGDPAALGARSIDLAAERKELEGKLAALAPRPNVVALHPAILDRYAMQMEKLSAMLREANVEGDPGATAALRELVECVTVHPDDTRRGGFMVEITGRIAALLGEEAVPAHRIYRSLSGKSVVAEDGFEPPTRGL